MEVFMSFVGILGVLCLGIMSPGPSFVLVARTSLAISRENGLATAAGMGCGGMVFALLALFGIQTILLGIPVLYLTLKVLGGLYLIYLSYLIWRGANETIDLGDSSTTEGQKLSRSFKVGLMTQLSNPKTAIFYGSVFAALLPQNISLSLIIILAPIIFVLEAGWYSLVAVLLSSAAPRKHYLDSKLFLDRFASTAIGALGLKLLYDAVWAD
ncbi:MAG: threonine/homoserine/homoserine lactone efflux protein [Arenicella sp.]|jgi:threonine/homoserine/homoserine lactone efflux protein